jgi:hypothetical protein
MALGKKKFLLILVPFAVAALFAGYEGARVAWYRGYSVGARTGVIRKLSVKGPPYCKYLSGELVLQGAQPGMPIETWEFSVDDDSDKNPVVQQLHAAEKDGSRITLDYRQDLHSLFRCTPSEYFVVKTEK